MDAYDWTLVRDPGHFGNTGHLLNIVTFGGLFTYCPLFVLPRYLGPKDRTSLVTVLESENYYDDDEDQEEEDDGDLPRGGSRPQQGRDTPEEDWDQYSQQNLARLSSPPCPARRGGAISSSRARETGRHASADNIPDENDSDWTPAPAKGGAKRGATSPRFRGAQKKKRCSDDVDGDGGIDRPKPSRSGRRAQRGGAKPVSQRRKTLGSRAAPTGSGAAAIDDTDSDLVMSTLRSFQGKARNPSQEVLYQRAMAEYRERLTLPRPRTAPAPAMQAPNQMAPSDGIHRTDSAISIGASGTTSTQNATDMIAPQPHAPTLQLTGVNQHSSVQSDPTTQAVTAQEQPAAPSEFPTPSADGPSAEERFRHLALAASLGESLPRSARRRQRKDDKEPQS